jgi:hypothetical protein
MPPPLLPLLPLLLPAQAMAGGVASPPMVGAGRSPSAAAAERSVAANKSVGRQTPPGAVDEGGADRVPLMTARDLATSGEAAMGRNDCESASSSGLSRAAAWMLPSVRRIGTDMEDVAIDRINGDCTAGDDGRSAACRRMVDVGDDASATKRSRGLPARRGDVGVETGGSATRGV